MRLKYYQNRPKLLFFFFFFLKLSDQSIKSSQHCNRLKLIYKPQMQQSIKYEIKTIFLGSNYNQITQLYNLMYIKKMFKNKQNLII